MTLELNASYGAPLARKMMAASPELAVSRLIKRNPRASIEKIAKLYAQESRDDPDLADANAYWVATNAAKNILRRAGDISPRKLPTEEGLKIAARGKAAAAKITRAWFAQIMQCTFGEVAKLANAAPGLAKLAKMGKPNQIVADVLSEKSVAKILG